MFSNAYIGDVVHLDLQALYATSQIQDMNDCDKTRMISKTMTATIEQLEQQFVTLNVVCALVLVKLSANDFVKHAQQCRPMNRRSIDELTDQHELAQYIQLIVNSPHCVSSYKISQSYSYSSSAASTITNSEFNGTVEQRSTIKTCKHIKPKAISTLSTNKTKRNKHSQENHSSQEHKLTKFVPGVELYISLQGVEYRKVLPIVLSSFRNHKMRFIVNKMESDRCLVNLPDMQNMQLSLSKSQMKRFVSCSSDTDKILTNNEIEQSKPV